jgi:hypothetical protein
VEEFVGKRRTVLTNGDYPIGILSITSMRKTPLVKGDSIGYEEETSQSTSVKLSEWLKMMEAKQTRNCNQIKISSGRKRGDPSIHLKPADHLNVELGPPVTWLR